MNTNSSAGNIPQKRAVLPGLARWIFRLLRLFWLTELILLVVFLYGRYAGWSAPQQWSNAFFLAAAAQIIFAGITVMGGSDQTVMDASYVRYVAKGDISETRNQLFLDYLHKMNIGVRMLIGGLLTLLISGLFLWV